jgi:hypothetical protein
VCSFCIYDEYEASLANHNFALPPFCPATPPLITTSQVPPIVSPPLTYKVAIGIAKLVLSSTSLVVVAPTDKYLPDGIIIPPFAVL